MHTKGTGRTGRGAQQATARERSDEGDSLRFFQKESRKQEAKLAAVINAEMMKNRRHGDTLWKRVRCPWIHASPPFPEQE